MTRYAMNVLGLTLMLGGALLLLMGDRLTVQVSPRVCFAPCTVRVRVQADRHPENRQVTVEVAGERYESTSAVLMDGDASPRTLPYFWFRDLPPGLYRVEAILQSDSRIVSRVSSEVQIN